jgi:PAS domain S-box-containing protein
MSVEAGERLPDPEQSLETLQRLRAALRAARIGTWSLDLAAGLATFDDNLNAILGLAAAESRAPFAACLHHVHAADRDRVRHAIEAAVGARREFVLDLRVVRPDGDVRWLRGRGRVLVDGRGVAVGVAGGVMDVTDDRQQDEPERPAHVRRELRGRRVLAVHDDGSMQEIVATMLLMYGVVVRTARRPAQAMQVLVEWRPEVLVAELAMPGEDGCALMRRVRALPSPLGAIPAVAVTAVTDPQSVQQSFGAGFDAHLAKPLEPHVLADALARVLRLRRTL